MKILDTVITIAWLTAAGYDASGERWGWVAADILLAAMFGWDAYKQWRDDYELNS